MEAVGSHGAKNHPLDGEHPVPIARSYSTIVLVILLLLIGSGTMYGYNALRPVLIESGAYAELCGAATGCAEQRLSLNLAETLSFVVADIAVLPSGILMDYIGCRALSWILLLGYASGYGIMVLASWTNVGHLYLTSLLILGGVPACTSLVGNGSAKLLHDVNYTHYVSAGVALCYEVSPMFMYILKLVIPKYLSLEKAMAVFLVLTSGLCAALGFTHMTKEEAVAIDRHHGRIKETDRKDDNTEFWNHFNHPRFLLHALFLTVVNAKNQFYVATFADQINYFSSPEESELSNNLFDVGFFLSPIIAMPFVIYFLSVYRERHDKVFGLLWAMTMIHAVLNTFGKEYLICQLVAMIIFFLLRPLKWAAAAEFLHQKPYKLSMYGRLFGVVSITCAAGSILIYPLTRLSYYYFAGSFFEANLFLTFCELSVVAFPLYLYYERKNGWPRMVDETATDHHKIFEHKGPDSKSNGGCTQVESDLRNSKDYRNGTDNYQQFRSRVRVATIDNEQEQSPLLTTTVTCARKTQI